MENTGKTDGTRKRAFVLAPFEPEFDRIYDELILPTLSDAGFDVSRADSLLDQRNILKDIISGIDCADLIIADLTTTKPNVMYEVGVAHALLKRTVILTQDIDSLPFDLRSYRAILYSTHFDRAAQLKSRIREVAVQVAQGGIVFENPVSDFAPSVIRRQRLAGSVGAGPSLDNGATLTGDRALGIKRALSNLDLYTEEAKALVERVDKAWKAVRAHPVADTLCVDLVALDAPARSKRVRTAAKQMIPPMKELAEALGAASPELGRLLGLQSGEMATLFSLAPIELREVKAVMMSAVRSATGIKELFPIFDDALEAGAEHLGRFRGATRELDRLVAAAMLGLKELGALIKISEAMVGRISAILGERMALEEDAPP
jgi:hypothetical protein